MDTDTTQEQGTKDVPPHITIHTTDRRLGALAKGIRLNEISDGRLENLRALCQAKIDANESFTDAVKVVAEKANMQPAALSAYVTALVKDTLEKTQEKADQLSLLFEEFGE